MDTFPSEANALLEQMVHGRLVQSEIVSHEEDGVPYVQLYDCLAGGVMYCYYSDISCKSNLWKN